MPALKKVSKPKANKNNAKKKAILNYSICLVKGLISAMCIFALLALIYYKMESRPDALYYLTYIAVGFGAFYTSLSAYSKFKGRGIVTGALAAVPYTLIVLILIMIFGGFSSFALIEVPVSIICGCLGGIAGANKKRR